MSVRQAAAPSRPSPGPGRAGPPGRRARAVPVAPGPGADAATDVVRWAAFSCALVPFVLLGYGTSFAGAAATALGLAAVTAACRVLLRRSERVPARLLPAPTARPARAAPHRGRHSRTGTGNRPPHRGGRHGAGCAPVD
ncbi:hypothetical protein ACFPM3_33680 [Streptomyces coeruleoprunus]|uniref:Uncharacterized protein n=1 Tax=Streptomyces coeruleoprunus TaxID=285563 RepID=A0ABV9XRB8_9ACTN